jgi:hypothetical protein
VSAFPLSPVLASLTFPPLLVSSLCVLFHCCPSLPCSLSLPFLSLGSACFSSVACSCLAHFPLLVSRWCVLFLCHPSLPHSFSFPFSSLESACFSSVTCPCLAHFPFSSLGSACFPSVVCPCLAHCPLLSHLQGVCDFTFILNLSLTRFFLPLSSRL